MHGRLKVKSAAHLEQERAAAKQKKLEGYRSAMAMIFELRGQESSPERDLTLLKVAENVLLSNASLSTLWNIRRQVIINRLQSGDTDEVKVLLEKENDLTQHCLMNDPKSYGAWHHRGWAIAQMSDPEWSTEVQLTSKFLHMDERNFHCWDYRRFVLSQLPQLSGKGSELQFSTDAIHVNFSNYSAWHYRSKLLPLVHPCDKSLIGITEQVRRDELDLVQNAAFTDPEDSSAWFYHRWLLASTDHADTPKIWVARKVKPGVAVAISKDVKGGVSATNGMVFKSSNGSDSDCLWIAPCPKDSDQIEIQLTVDGIKVDSVSFSGTDGFVSEEVCRAKTSWNDPTTEQLLKEEMENCRQLLDLEPDSKWTMLTLALIAQSVDPEEHREEILSLYDKLQTVDAKRRRYYADQRSKFVIRQQVAKFFSDRLEKLDLSRQRLTVIYCKQLLAFACEIDLSHNSLESAKTLGDYLIQCQKLHLSGNREGCQLPKQFASQEESSGTSRDHCL